MGLFDVHAHLTSSRFSGDLDAVLERAQEAGVTTIISNGLNRQDNIKTLELAARFPQVKAALGLYPVDAVLPQMLASGVEYPRDELAVEPPELTIEFIKENVGSAVAIGEIGLDHHWVPEPFWKAQEAIFVELVQLAMNVDLPIIIHTRKAERRTLDLLLELGAPRVNWHCFSSRLKLGRQIAEAGHFLSIPAQAARSETFSGLLRGAPREQLLLETDCPYLAPTAGERNEPKNVGVTLGLAATLWGQEPAAALETFENNFERLFRFRP